MKNVLLCGCGNIGFRHLEAIIQVSDPLSITIVEPNVSGHGRIQDLIETRAGAHAMTLLDAVPDVATQYDLVVIATSADTRRGVVETILDRHAVTVMILEKVLFQSLQDLAAVQDLLAEKSVATYVNCGRRYLPGYLSLVETTVAARPLDITVTGSAWGMASNGIHFLDLAEFLNASQITDITGSQLLAGSVPTKRQGCVEIFGTFTAQLANGATLNVTCTDDPDLTFSVALQGQDLSLIVDELGRKTIEGDTSRPFEFKYVSECVEIYDDALQTGTCGLTPYNDSLRQHRFFLSMVLNHLGQSEDSLCPIS